MRHGLPEPAILANSGNPRNTRLPADVGSWLLLAGFADRQSSIRSLISSELAFSSGAYIALALVGRALNFPGISARMR